MIPANHIDLSHHHAQQHSLEPGRRVIGHKIVVKGAYIAKTDERDGGGAARRRNENYEESFVLPPSEESLVESNALSRLLSSGALATRLRAKDENFRGLLTHVVSSHENVLEPKEEFKKRIADEIKKEK